MNYAILNAQGQCINRVLWDGESDWQPPEGCTAVPDPDNLLQIYAESQSEPEAAPPAPQPRWVEFGTALGTDALVNQFIASLAQAAPVLHLMVGVGMGQAAQGDSQTFLAAWAMGTAQGLITPELAAHVAELAEQHDLSAEFASALVA